MYKRVNIQIIRVQEVLENVNQEQYAPVQGQKSEFAIQTKTNQGYVIYYNQDFQDERLENY